MRPCCSVGPSPLSFQGEMKVLIGCRWIGGVAIIARSCRPGMVMFSVCGMQVEMALGHSPRRATGDAMIG